MRDSLKNKCDLFANNYKDVSKYFKWTYSTNHRLGALMYTMEDRPIDVTSIDRCRKVIKENTGIFSQFKDTTNFITAVMLSLQTEPETVLKEALNVYDAMKKEKFHSSPYLVLAAMTIVLQTDPYHFHTVIRTARSYYDAMKEQHRFITSSDDYGFAALLALTDKSVHQAIREMEECYKFLKERFRYANAVQALSHILTFSELEVADKCTRVIELRQDLMVRNCKFGLGMELSFLGVVALLNESTVKIADEIADVNEYMKNKKGFGYWSVSKSERLMYAMALVCDDYLTDQKKNKMEMTLANNITGIILAQQMAMLSATSASTAAAASSV
jgi:hypothetical protein